MVQPRAALLFAALLGAGVLAVTLAFALAPHVVDWYAVVAGGGSTSSSQHVLSGSVGQTSVGAIGSDQHQMALGFWPGLLASERLPTPGPPSRTPTATGTAPTASATASASSTATRTPRLTVTPTRTRPARRTSTPTATASTSTVTPEATPATPHLIYVPLVAREQAMW